MGASTWVFDPVTYQFIGEQDGSSGGSAILLEGFVARMGQLPGKAAR